MDWWTFFFGVWAGAATVMMIRYRRVARQALDLAESCNKSWAITIEGLRNALSLIDSQQHPDLIDDGAIIITKARPIERKDLVN